MRGYIKEHPSEFGRSDEPCDVIDEKTPTEAEMYAAEAKRKRHEDDLGYIQGGLDKVSSGLSSIGTGIAAVFRALSDMASEGSISKELIFTIIIVILVLSNIYTYTAQPTRNRQEREHDLSEAVRLLLAQSRHTTDAQGLLQILENVEARVQVLRTQLAT